MTAGIVIGLALISALLFPWPLTALLAAIAAWFEPLAAFAIGIFADAIYYSVHAARLPYMTIGGALLSLIAVFVRSRLKASTIWK